MHPIERHARRRGGPLDSTFIEAPCSACGIRQRLPMRSLTTKRVPKCSACGVTLARAPFDDAVKELLVETCQQVKAALRLKIDQDSK